MTSISNAGLNPFPPPPPPLTFRPHSYANHSQSDWTKANSTAGIQSEGYPDGNVTAECTELGGLEHLMNGTKISDKVSTEY